MVARAQALQLMRLVWSSQEEAPAEEEVEVTFEEEIPRDALRTPPPLPEYKYSGWLLSLPALCIFLLAWNVRWKSGEGRHARNRKKARKKS